VETRGCPGNRKAEQHNKKVVADYNRKVDAHNRKAERHNKAVVADINRQLRIASTGLSKNVEASRPRPSPPPQGCLLSSGLEPAQGFRISDCVWPDSSSARPSGHAHVRGGIHSCAPRRTCSGSLVQASWTDAASEAGRMCPLRLGFSGISRARYGDSLPDTRACRTRFKEAPLRWRMR
jgi:hypothetical protein